MKISEIIQNLKAAGQDHEFYPTTHEIIAALLADVKWRSAKESVLDIGAGTGKVLAALETGAGFEKLYAIEKSSILCRELPRNVMVIGTAFEEQSLLGKPVDVVFSNPPYSVFEDWAEKIIREAGAEVVYLVLPVRWQNSPRLADALKFREAKAKVLGHFTFEDAEDRAARANVNLIRVELHKDKDEDDAFTRFFNAQFSELVDKFKATEARPAGDKAKAETDGEPEPANPFAGLVVGPNYPEALVALYNEEMAKIHANYLAVSKLDAALLKEFEIYPKTIMAGLRARLSGLKNVYWMELFSHLAAVTDRLTAKSRTGLLNQLHQHVTVDFTVSNILEVIIWVIKNANGYLDQQLLDTYAVMVEKCNVQLYKSNQKTWVDQDWRYNSDETEKNSHYALDYRIVTHRLGGCSLRWSGRAELADNAANFIGDLLTIARNLGFVPTDNQRGSLDYSGRQNWTPGEQVEFFFKGSNATEILFDVRPFKNGNCHFRLNQKFMLALNVEHGRLRGWLRSCEQAAEELKDPAAAQYFNAHTAIGMGEPLKMLN